MAEKKYASLSTLSTFLDNLRNIFASITHSHKISDISDYTVDTSLSSTSSNPVANSVLNAEFDEIAVSMNALETAIDTYSTESQTYTDNAVAQKTQVKIITWEDEE